MRFRLLGGVKMSDLCPFCKKVVKPDPDGEPIFNLYACVDTQEVLLVHIKCLMHIKHEDPLNDALYIVSQGLPESLDRVKRIKDKFRPLLHTSHGYGAGSQKHSYRYLVYSEVAKKCNEALK